MIETPNWSQFCAKTQNFAQNFFLLNQNKLEILVFWIDIRPIWVSVVAVEYVTFVTATLSQIDRKRRASKTILNPADKKRRS